MTCDKNTCDMMIVIYGIASIIAGIVWTSYDCDKCGVESWIIYALVRSAIILVLPPTIICIVLGVIALFVNMVFCVFMFCCNTCITFSERCYGSNNEETVPLV